MKKTPDPAPAICSPVLSLDPRSMRDLSASIAHQLAHLGFVGPAEPLAVPYAEAARLLGLGCPETARNMANRGDLERVQLGSGPQSVPRITMKSIRAILERKAEAQEQAAA